MNDLGIKGKKLLILGGNSAHNKVVEAAGRMGVYTIVTDYQSPDLSPAKKISDEYWMISYGDIDALARKCREEHVDGVLTCYHESSLVPYYHLCEKLGFPCYGDLEQFETLTNKRLFKKLCVENGVQTIPEFDLDDARQGNVEFPVIVKPADRCGSNGMSICTDAEELKIAISKAEKESPSGEIIIEKYIKGKNSFQVTYFFIDGTPYIIRTVDGYKGAVEKNLDRVALCSVSPSVYTDVFLKTASPKFADMLLKLGVRNGPVMAQGFYDDGVFRFYDPGRRFPGTDFEIIYNELFHVDLVQMMVCFALTGKLPSAELRNESVFLDGKQVVVLFPTMGEGTIREVIGYDALRKNGIIRNIVQKHGPGTVISRNNTVFQRIFEIGFISPSPEKTKETIRFIQDSIDVIGTEGTSMIYEPFDIRRLIG